MRRRKTDPIGPGRKREQGYPGKCRVTTAKKRREWKVRGAGWAMELRAGCEEIRGLGHLGRGRRGTGTAGVHTHKYRSRMGTEGSNRQLGVTSGIPLLS